jgi:TetR/AcrR family transcriptional repressor for divergent bdcA
VTTKNKSRPRGRPRAFDPEEAVATAQQLFHERGYDAVSVSDVTEELGIKPPSFYAAFGNKGGLYARVLERYAATGAIPICDLMRADRPVAEGLAAVLEEAARRYAADPGAAGCMVLEGLRSNDPEARSTARGYHANAEEVIYKFIAERHPEKANQLADFMSTTMTGLSAMARNGYSLDRLLASARLASQAIAQTIPA